MWGSSALVRMAGDTAETARAAVIFSLSRSSTLSSKCVDALWTTVNLLPPPVAERPDNLPSDWIICAAAACACGGSARSNRWLLTPGTSHWRRDML